MDIKELLAYCDHTLLRVDCTEAEIRKLCDQAIKYGCASVCIPPCHVPGAKRYRRQNENMYGHRLPERIYVHRRKGL